MSKCIVAASDPIVDKLVALFGIPPHCTKFVITVQVGEIVKVDCEFYATIDGEIDLETEHVKEQFVLCRKEEADAL